MTAATGAMVSLALCGAGLGVPLRAREGRCMFDGLCGSDCLGTTYGGRHMPPKAREYIESLDPQRAAVWSFGAGGDVSWDVTMACKYKLTVTMFDPTPSVPEHIEAVHNLVGTGDSSKYNGKFPGHATCKDCRTYWSDIAQSTASGDLLPFYPYALSHLNGNVTYYGPTVKDESASWSLDGRMRPYEAKKMVVPGRTLPKLMEELHTPAIDILKLSLEGGESWAIQQVLKLPADRRPKLIFADFLSIGHDTCKGNSEACATKHAEGLEAISRLLAAGYTMVKREVEMTFQLEDSNATRRAQ